jgi:predicted transcriptional regulator
MASPLDKIAKRFGITVREARDIATAVGSAAQAVRKAPQEGMPVKKAIKNVAKQVKEVGRAATTGKKGTTAMKVKPNPSSQEKRKAAGGKGFVTYDVTKPKKR